MPERILNNSFQVARCCIFKQSFEHVVTNKDPMRFAGLNGDWAPVFDTVERQTGMAPSDAERHALEPNHGFTLSRSVGFLYG